MNQQLIRLPAVLERTGLGRSTLFAKIAAGEFPRQVKLGARSAAWVEAEVTEWVKGRIAASRGTQH